MKHKDLLDIARKYETLMNMLGEAGIPIGDEVGEYNICHRVNGLCVAAIEGRYSPGISTAISFGELKQVDSSAFTMEDFQSLSKLSSDE